MFYHLKEACKFVGVEEDFSEQRIFALYKAYYRSMIYWNKDTQSLEKQPVSSIDTVEDLFVSLPLKDNSFIYYIPLTELIQYFGLERNTFINNLFSQTPSTPKKENKRNDTRIKKRSIFFLSDDERISLIEEYSTVMKEMMTDASEIFSCRRKVDSSFDRLQLWFEEDCSTVYSFLQHIWDARASHVLNEKET